MSVQPLTTPFDLHRARAIPAVAANADVDSTSKRFIERFDDPKATAAARKEAAPTLVNEYYDLVTDFYM